MLCDYLDPGFCLKSPGTPTCPFSGMAAPPGEINDSVQGLEVLEGIVEAYSLHVRLQIGHCLSGPGRENIISRAIYLPLEKLPEINGHHLYNNKLSREIGFCLIKTGLTPTSGEHIPSIKLDLPNLGKLRQQCKQNA